MPDTTPTPAEIGHSLPLKPAEVAATLDLAKAQGPEEYARWLRVAAADGYELPEGHRRALTGLGSSAAVPDEANEGFVSAADPADYRMNLAPYVPEGDTRTLAGVEAAVRSALHDMGLPAGSGGSIAEMGFKSAEAYGQLDEAGQQLWQATQRAQLAKVFPNVAETVAKIDRMVEAIGDKEAAAILASSGFFSAQVIGALAIHADAIAARRNR